MGEMSSTGKEIAHVSDTALMVAACRAHETELEDAFVRDPFASLLEALAAHPIATVLNLGCGLDTRPWRLDLPPDLRWIEIDLAGVLEYKYRLMSGETPRCRLDHLAIDLNNSAQRRMVYDSAGSSPALMITEGLLLYLPAATVDSLAAESWNQRIACWIGDLTTSAFTKTIGGADTMQSIRHVQAADALQGEQIFDLIRRQGWTTAAWRSYVTDIGFALERVRRMMAGASPPPLALPPDDPTGVHLFARP